jgi:hypothetical protein
MYAGWLLGVVTGNSSTIPEVVSRPILLPLNSVNHKFPSGPAVMPVSALVGVMTGKSVIVFGLFVRMRPTRFAVCSVNHMLPSDPAAMPDGPLGLVGKAKSVIVPVGVIRSMRLPKNSTNQRFPSGPAAMLNGPVLGDGNGNSVICAIARLPRIGSTTATIHVNKVHRSNRPRSPCSAHRLGGSISTG